MSVLMSKFRKIGSVEKRSRCLSDQVSFFPYLRFKSSDPAYRIENTQYISASKQKSTVSALFQYTIYEKSALLRFLRTTLWINKKYSLRRVGSPWRIYTIVTIFRISFGLNPDKKGFSTFYRISPHIVFL